MKKILWLAVMSMVFASSLSIDKKYGEDNASPKNRLITVAAPDKYTCWPRIGKVGDKLVNVYVKALQHNDPHNGVGAIYASTSKDGINWTSVG